MASIYHSVLSYCAISASSCQPECQISYLDLLDHFAVDTSIEDFGPVTIASYFYSFTPFSCFIDNKG